MGEGAVVKLEIGEDAGFFVGAIGFDEGALIGGIADESAL